MVIYRLSNIISRKFVKDRKPFGVVNDMGVLINKVSFPIMDINGVETKHNYREVKFVDRFFICCPVWYSNMFADRPKFSFRIVKQELHTVSER